jgi:hypothetical protein
VILNLACIKYLQQPLPKHLEKKPMKRKEKKNGVVYKGWKKQQKFVYTHRKEKKVV